MSYTSESDHATSKLFHPLLGQKQQSPPPQTLEFKAQVSVNKPGFLAHHCVYDVAILPATAYVEMVLALGHTEFGIKNWTIENISIQQALILRENTQHDVQLTLTSGEDNRSTFQILSEVTGGQPGESSPIFHSSGSLVALHQPSDSSHNIPVVELTSSLQISAVDAFYQDCEDRGIMYGPCFQVVEQLWRRDGKALGQIKLPADLLANASDYIVHPVLLDSCFQVLWAALPEAVKGETYLPVGIEQLNVIGDFPEVAGSLWSYAQLHASQESRPQTMTADLYLCDPQGTVVVEAKGVVIEHAHHEALLGSLRQRQTLAISSTYTAEPVEDALAFWMQELDLPFQIQFAPYNQVFQELLNPSSLLSSNHEGVNAVLVRLEDWNQGESSLQLKVSPAEKERYLAERAHFQLPNRVEVAHLNPYETEYLYKEIFIDQVYQKHGVVLQDGDCVVDIGANIGLFTLFVQQQCPNGTVYAFEPAPHAFDKLQCNATLYGQNTHLFNCGLGGSDSVETFTFYPNSSVFSSFAADSLEDEQAIRAVILNMLQRDQAMTESEIDALADEFLKDRLNKETYQAQLRTLSSIIEEHQIGKIDLLKLDAEKSELPVLQGIKEEHWPIIQQMVVEVHDQEGSIIEAVKTLLRTKGFELIIDEEDMLQSSGLYNIYAIRPEARRTPVAVKNEVNTGKIEKNIQDLCDSLRSAAGRSSTPHIVCICPNSPDAIADPTVHSIYQQMETKLVSEVEQIEGIYSLTSSMLSTLYPVSSYYDPHGHQFGHVPYTSAFFAALGTALARKVYAIQHPSYKVIALDCDGTLWQGVCGEDGAQGIEISPSYQFLQAFMVAQQEAGMLLCLCSKNSEADVWAVFDARSDMPLKRDHLVQSKVNWSSKSDNIKALAAELNLGLDSFIFIDDNPIECAEVQTNCPQVLTLQLPTNADDIPHFLKHVWAFDHLQTTKEDQQRTVLYQQEVQREHFRQGTLTFSDFLAGLELKVDIGPMTAQQLSRVSQLTHRTNQFNFTTIRRSETEIQQLLASNQYECLTVQVSDRFGEYGLVGAVLFSTDGTKLQVDTFLLSCRTLGRGVEYQMLAQLGAIAQSRGLASVEVLYKPTPKNQPAMDFLNRVGTEVKHPVGNDWQFTFDSAIAAQLAFTPTERAPEQEASSSSAPKRSVLTSTVTQVDSNTIHRIATQFNNPEEILQVVEAQRHRDRPDLNEPFVPPSNDFEAELAKIWSEVLGLDQVGVHDNFFELGGRSLLMVQVHTKLQEKFASNISPVDLFKYPTIHALANQLREGQGEQPSMNLPTQTADQRAQRKREARNRRQQQRQSRRR
ncbi:FkbM family methyltransferase [Acaryochloris sp. IP29b_bin.148]|uniref:FkbM family methyltransferase n=1 Tax=Acaryochloris sp. IP29b_bin.148 TaxID=2969218 RepID=UPI002625D956|nr:FkbM family methyltransferase [Acaryochloris sp. IP29b_bin.148]